MNASTDFRRAQRIASVELSEIVRLSEQAAALRRAGRDVIVLSTGEPDFPTPAPVVEAAHAAALAGQTRYTATAGTSELRDSVATKAGVTRAEVLISAGAKQVLANAMLATLDPGDEVLIPAPYWSSYTEIVKMAGGRAVVVPCLMSDDFKLSPEALEAAITPKTRWLMLNSPSNPTGAVYSTNEIRAFAKVLERHPNIWVISDEIYEHLSYVPVTSFRDAAPDLMHRTLIVNGLSKAWAMTGWRIGWGIGPSELIEAMTVIQGQVTSGACSISQAAGLAALNGDDGLLKTRRDAFRARRDKTVAGLNAIRGFRCPRPDGAFYVFPSVTRVMERGGFPSDGAFCSWLLDKAGVAVVPGRAFGLGGHVRISFAYADDELTEGIDRIFGAVDKLG
ncbi:pyridoxal phosphate-dependent aminotransferase [Leisingera daeponensis]|uniref:pyridoxal phosphate-dependent aminotransferase n=1 Tax=Leisingera daeponensis TaxID=405746 RepID=UPI001C940963|nr:pyridoxal phosphate-dependent aminotransferase [Leisingera daeponensis]MBY6059554.1 pyridoxal phosphate-dependent aminotransferase [Leisingera daeponensis]